MVKYSSLLDFYIYVIERSFSETQSFVANVYTELTITIIFIIIDNREIPEV